MASTSTWMSAQPEYESGRAGRPPAALRIADIPVMLTVWMICVCTDWSTPAKVLLNVAAVGLLCLKEVAVHRYLMKQQAQPVHRPVILRRVPEPALQD